MSDIRHEPLENFGWYVTQRDDGGWQTWVRQDRAEEYTRLAPGTRIYRLAVVEEIWSPAKEHCRGTQN